MSEYIELIVANDDKTNVKELSLYLSQLEKLYAFLLRKPELIKQAKVYSQNSEFSDELISEKALLQALQESKFSSKNLMQYQKSKKLKGDLDIVRLSKNSPLEIVFAAVIPFLAAAMVLSGGKVDIESLGQKIKFNIPSLVRACSNFKNLENDLKMIKNKENYRLKKEKVL